MIIASVLVEGCGAPYILYRSHVWQMMHLPSPIAVIYYTVALLLYPSPFLFHSLSFSFFFSCFFFFSFFTFRGGSSLVVLSFLTRLRTRPTHGNFSSSFDFLVFLSFFFSFLPAFLFLEPFELSFVYQFYVLGALFMSTTLVVFLLIVFFSSTISKYLVDFKIFHIFMKWIQILIFISIAFVILFSVWSIFK